MSREKTLENSNRNLLKIFLALFEQMFYHSYTRDVKIEKRRKSWHSISFEKSVLTYGVEKQTREGCVPYAFNVAYRDTYVNSYVRNEFFQFLTHIVPS